MYWKTIFAMRRIIAVILAMGSLACAVSSAQIKIGNRSVNIKKAVQAASDVTKAITLSDEDIARMSRESVEWMDEHNPIDTCEYDARLRRLTEGITEVDGLALNFKVYYVIDVNAFACGDGSIRVFSSLMDIMDDDELMAIIGHEIGHVVHHDVKDAMKSAYMASAALNAAGAAGGKIGQLSDSQLGDLAAALLDAQFSQKQEYAADESWQACRAFERSKGFCCAENVFVTPGQREACPEDEREGRRLRGRKVIPDFVSPEKS